jgi:predicted ATPase
MATSWMADQDRVAGDRLASVRHVAQIGAAIGREFPYALLQAVSRLPEDELQTALARLVASELVFQRGRPPDALYSFKHALVQDAAHGSLLRSSRQQLHAQIADALEAHSPEMIENQPELFAQHYAEAGLVQKSVASWGKAGQQVRRPIGNGGGGRAIPNVQVPALARISQRGRCIGALDLRAGHPQN